MPSSRRLEAATMPDWRVLEVENELRFRNANEAIETASDVHGHQAMEVYICECSDAGCTAPISLTRIEYEGIRSHGSWFAIATDHENPEIDHVLVENTRFSTIAKLPGDPARLAEFKNPRRWAPAWNH
jgi:hypothetical protein